MTSRRLLSALLLGLALAVRLGAGEPTPASLGSEGVIYPRNSAEARRAESPGGSFSLVSTLGLVAALAGAGFWLLKRGNLSRRAGAAVHERLAIEETRPLGNKQFLAVASYGDRRMLLSVCPGRIDLLCRLDEPAKPDAVPEQAHATAKQG